jgi:hypothetical protein
MAGPAYYSVAIFISMNEDWAVPFQYTSSVGPPAVPIDLTGSTLRMQLRKQESDHEAEISVWSPNNGIWIYDAVNGKFQIIITRGAMLQLVPGDYVCDLVRTMTTGYQERIFEGTATVVEGTTR